MTGCYVCGRPAVVEIAGISEDTNLCMEHLTPPYSEDLIKRIFNGMKTETVVSFVKTIYDKIEQDKLLRDTDSRIEEIMHITGIDKLGQIEKERDAAIITIRDLESKIQAQSNEIKLLTKDVDKYGEIQRIVEESESRLEDKITESKDFLSDAFLTVQDAIIAKINSMSVERTTQPPKRPQLTPKRPAPKRGDQPEQVKPGGNEHQQEIEQELDPETPGEED